MTERRCATCGAAIAGPAGTAWCDDACARGGGGCFTWSGPGPSRERAALVQVVARRRVAVLAATAGQRAATDDSNRE